MTGRQWNGPERRIRSSADYNEKRRSEDRAADDIANATTQFGDSAVDRRKARENVVTADLHYALSRRVSDLKDRVGMVEQMAHDLSRAHDELRSHLMGQVGLVVAWCREHDNVEGKKAYLQALLTFSNVAAVACFVLWLLTK